MHLTHATNNKVQSPLFSADNLSVHYRRDGRSVTVVHKLSFDINIGESLAVVGESGSGKTQAFLSVLQLLSTGGLASGRALYRKRDLLSMPLRELDELRGSELAMIFQDPMTALNPSMRLMTQLTEGPRRRQKWTRPQAHQKAIAMLELVGVPDAKRWLSAYPHELSGGLRQRAVIAMALLCEPKLLIADEPTTALDATVQAQILSLLANLRKKFSLSSVIITHDLAIVGGLCDRVMVMYAGRIVEIGPVHTVFSSPRHPYTAGLLASTPRIETVRPGTVLPMISGHPPESDITDVGCSFAPRCPYAIAHCKTERPVLSPRNPNHLAACHRMEKISVAAFQSSADHTNRKSPLLS